MAQLNLVVPHHLSREEALSRIKHLLDGVRQQYSDKITNVHENWNGYVGTFSFSAMGFPVAGTLTVNDADVILDGTGPFLLSIYKTQIEATIRQRATTLLA